MAITLDGTTGVTAAEFDGTVDASNLTGDIAASMLTGALPAIDGSALTSLAAGNLTGTLPAIDGSALTNLPAAYTALSKAQTGYITLTGGLIIQWGRSGSINAGGGNTYDAFPIAFPNACFTAAMSITTSTFSNTWPWTIQISNSGLNFRAHGSIAAVSGNWIAIGH